MLNRKFIILLAFLLFLNLNCRRADTDSTSTVPVNSGSYNSSVRYDGMDRTYYIHIPTSYDKSRSFPLVILLHGLGGTGEGMSKLTGFDKLADKEGFIVIYPDGRNRFWKCDGRIKKNDDVGFISFLIDEVSKSLNIDKKRIYATGMSNGGFMCIYLACELSDKISAIAPVVATMTEYQYNNFSPKKPVSVLTINGTEDKIVPWNGGEINVSSNLLKGVGIVSTYDAVKFWVFHNQCATTPVVTRLEDKSTQDGTKVRREVYSGGKDSTEVILYAIEGGGHTWPGGLQYLPDDRVGKVCQDINACEVIWEFFKKVNYQSPMAN